MERITVKQAAEILNVTPQFVRIGIQRGWLPIGSAVKLPKSTQWTYLIPRERLETYLRGNDIVNGVEATTAERISYYDNGRASENHG